MNRRAFVTGLRAVLSAPLAAEAQQPGNVHRIGFLGTATPFPDVRLALGIPGRIARTRLLDRRRELLRAALGFLALEPREPELMRLHRCFDNWRGIGDVVAGKAREEYDFELRRYDGRGWRAIFFQSGFEHSLTSHAGAAWARSPWEAVQLAAEDAWRKLESPEAAPRDWTTTNDAPV